MLPADIICLIALTLFGGLLIWAAISDCRRFQIPNQVSLAALALYPVYAASSPIPVQWWWALAIAAGFFLVGFCLYLARALGGGDAKLLPVVVLWAGPKQLALFVLALAIASVVLSAIMGARAAIAQYRASERTQESPGAAAVELSALARVHRAVIGFGYLQLLKVKLPYGVAIGVGGVAVAVNAAFTVVR